MSSHFFFFSAFSLAKPQISLGLFCSSPRMHVFAGKGSLQTEKYHKHQPGTVKSQAPTQILPKRQCVALGKITSPPCRLSICFLLIKWDYKTAPSQRAGKTLKVKIVLQAWYIIITQQKAFQASFLLFSAKQPHFKMKAMDRLFHLHRFLSAGGRLKLKE